MPGLPMTSIDTKAVEPEPAPFKWVGGLWCLDFNNTVDWKDGEPVGGELLSDYGRVVSWAEEAGIVAVAERRKLSRQAETRFAEAQRALWRAREVRGLIHRILFAVIEGSPPERDALEQLNGQLAEVPAQVEATSGDPPFVWGWPQRRGDLDAVLWPVVWSLAQFLTSPERVWLKTCANQSCGWLFLDSSRKHNRKWCEMAVCGNRAKARRFYRRKRRQSP